MTTPDSTSDGPESGSAVDAGNDDRGFKPAFKSLALASIPVPDYADVIVLPVPTGCPRDARLWAETIFSSSGTPGWVRALMAVRQSVVGLIGIRPAPAGIFAVAAAQGEEALISADDKHLDFRCGVALDAEAHLLRVTTAVRLKGWRGRLYFLPVRVLHPLVVRAMMARAIRSLSTR